MKTPSLSTPIDQFMENQNKLIRHWAAQFARSVDGETLSSEGLSREDMREASCLALTSCARNWELLRSDWHQRAIATDATTFAKTTHTRVEGILADTRVGKALKEASISVSVQVPKHPSLPVVQKMLDPEDQNITFRDKKESDRRAHQELSQELASKATSFSHEDWALINFVVATRNAIAHNSPSSITKMNICMKKLTDTKEEGLKSLARAKYRISKSGIGAYLYSQVATEGNYENVRVIYICLRMKTVAEKLRLS